MVPAVYNFLEVSDVVDDEVEEDTDDEEDCQDGDHNEEGQDGLVGTCDSASSSEPTAILKEV